ncbi:Hepatocyte growth factor receptor [Actinoplanes sp. SE50]|uniref:IPT/TIG domain-containing protein n=1 Tax=unclassified Actinoplanes TaxID=2626549 RepID=UPI00023EC519|nr:MULTISPECIES: IPT/TIG domain-containing protein [unclassified Actinoplanes]AEV87588.1 Hepatocyte growth factor receptor [Actinoplanes sp. SE50/110]ATO85991.1 Hepatocyte growth factor receptor [Actinoplanes sp. SE50]SLM03405.1 Hepatocyte growth factor receptor [Actinoplanes sp. SE50/110]
MISSRQFRRALLAGTVTTGLAVAGGPAPAYAGSTALPMTLSSATGPSGGGNTIIGTVTPTAANPNPFVAGSMPTVQFQYNTCTANARAVAAITGTGTAATGGVLTVNPDNVKRNGTTRIAFEVPSASYPAKVDDKDSTINTGGLVLTGTQTSAKWNICVYDSDSLSTSTLLAQAAYTIGVRPKITAIIPPSGAALGGQSITVTGAGFSATSNATTASIGGVPLTNIKVAANGNSFTATTGQRAAATGLTLIVNTPGGQVLSSDPDNNGLPQDADDKTPDAPITFTYSNGIQISPNTAPAGTKVDLLIKGVGFQQMTFDKSADATPTSVTAHVFLVKDAYVAASNRGVQECKKVLVASNTDLVCTLDLGADRLSPTDSSAVSGKTVDEGSYTVTVVANGATDAGDAAAPTVVSSGATFTVAPY